MKEMVWRTQGDEEWRTFDAEGDNLTIDDFEDGEIKIYEYTVREVEEE